MQSIENYDSIAKIKLGTEFDGFFEGSEKRILIKLNDFNTSNLDYDLLKKLLDSVNCKILGHIKNDHYNMYLLSESTLMTFGNIIILKTCGNTTPLEFVKALQNEISVEIIDFEYSHPYFIKQDLQPFPHKYLVDESKYLSNFSNKKISVCHNDYLNYFYTNKVFDKIEILLWEFTWTNKFIELLKDNIKNWVIDEFYFKPQGYSMNAIHNDKYMTVHVTPNKNCSYLSIETNLYIINIKNIIEVLIPKKFCIFSNNNEGGANLFKIDKYDPKLFINNGIVIESFS